MGNYHGYRAYGRRPSGPPLTPPAELVGKFVTYRPKGADGKRRPAIYVTVLAYDADTKTLSVEQNTEANIGNPTGIRRADVPLSNGPFTVV